MVGEKIKWLRESRQLTQKGFGELVGVSASAVGMWENNKRDVDTAQLLKISNTFDISLDELFGRNKSEDVKLSVPISQNVVAFRSEGGKQRVFLMTSENFEAMQTLAMGLSREFL